MAQNAARVSNIAIEVNVARSTNTKQLQRKAVETLFRAIVNGWFESTPTLVWKRCGSKFMK